jgi:hypothetical protein
MGCCERARDARSYPVSDNPTRSGDGLDYTTRSNKTHITETRVVHYRWHPWHGRTVVIFAELDKSNTTVLRCALEPAQTARPLEVPAWMFDETFCSRCALRNAPVVPWRSLRNLVELLRTADRLRDAVVVQDGQIVRPNPGGADATHDSPTAGRSTQSVSSGSTHATVDAIAAGGAAESAQPACAISPLSSPTAPRRRTRRGGAR